MTISIDLGSCRLKLEIKTKVSRQKAEICEVNKPFKTAERNFVTKRRNMATGGDLNVTKCQVKRRKIETGDLRDHEIEDLAQVIVSKHMATIAIKYLEIPYETVENLKLMKQNDYQGFNRDLLILWRNKNPGINQVQVRLFHNFDF